MPRGFQKKAPVYKALPTYEPSIVPFQQVPVDGIFLNLLKYTKKIAKSVLIFLKKVYI